MSIQHLPEFDLDPVLPIASCLIERGIGSFRRAAEYIRDLPYGRNSDRADYHLTLAEGRGTCSTKHALMAALAAEHGVAVDLMLGIYEMNGRNTPGVGAVLERYGLDALPEAHCYLRCGETRIDLTRNVIAEEAIERFLYEEQISPEHIGAYKVELHRRIMAEWGSGKGVGDLWNIREECIGALGNPR
ncbi:MAG: hypothetical protein ABI876_15900 [Bacteroidota bacterium]